MQPAHCGVQVAEAKRIFTKLRETEVALAQEQLVAVACRALGVTGTDVLALAWRGCGGIGVVWAKRPGVLEGRRRAAGAGGWPARR